MILWILLIIVIIYYRDLIGLIAYSVFGLFIDNKYLGGFGEFKTGFNNYSNNKSNNLIKYHIYDDDISNDSDNNFREDAIDIISKGWGVRYNLEHVDEPSYADITMELKPRRDLDQYHDNKEYYPGGKEIRFSLTFQSPQGKPYIYIDYDNWKYGIVESGLDLAEYRKYVVLHEFGHGLGFDHQKCNDELLENGRCPVMFQSTRGCGKYNCGFNITKFDTNDKIQGRNRRISSIVDQ